jgi:hypothetical protein
MKAMKWLALFWVTVVAMNAQPSAGKSRVGFTNTDVAAHTALLYVPSENGFGIDLRTFYVPPGGRRETEVETADTSLWSSPVNYSIDSLNGTIGLSASQHTEVTISAGPSTVISVWPDKTLRPDRDTQLSPLLAWAFVSGIAVGVCLLIWQWTRLAFEETL